MAFYIEVAPKYARTPHYMHLNMYARHLNCIGSKLDESTDHCFLCSTIKGKTRPI